VKVRETSLPGVLLIEPALFRDARGHFLETWSGPRYAALGLPPNFAQDCLSRSGEGVLRGIHYQWPNPQGKLVWVAEGAVLDVAIDLRRSSPHFGRWEAHELTAESGRQLWMPEGFAHAFLVTKAPCLFAYKCTRPYDPKGERAIRWDDPDLAIRWPEAAPVLSDKDRRAPPLRAIAPPHLPE